MFSYLLFFLELRVVKDGAHGKQRVSVVFVGFQNFLELFLGWQPFFLRKMQVAQQTPSIRVIWIDVESLLVPLCFIRIIS